MHAELISALKTVCTAGSAREGYNDESNDQLRQLANVGLLVVAYAPDLLTRPRQYKPSETGWHMFKQLLTKTK
jgi:hypothetical protein